MTRGKPGPARQSEAALQKDIVSFCRELGLLYFHSGDSRRDLGSGFPDMVIASRDGCGLIFAELKSGRGSLSSAQVDWKYAVIACGGGYSYRVWRPADWERGSIQRELRQIA